MSIKVYAVQESLKKVEAGRVIEKPDLSPARRWGELRYLLKWSEGRGDTSGAELQSLLWDRLAPFTADDYLLTSGMPAAIGAAIALAAERTGGPVAVLSWDRVLHDYRCYEFDFAA